MSEIQCTTKAQFFEALKWVTDLRIPFTAYPDALIVQVHTEEE